MKTSFIRIIFYLALFLSGLSNCPAQDKSSKPAGNKPLHDTLVLKTINEKMVNSVTGSEERQRFNEQIRLLSEKNLKKAGISQMERKIWRNSLAQYHTYQG